MTKTMRLTFCCLPVIAFVFAFVLISVRELRFRQLERSGAAILFDFHTDSKDSNLAFDVDGRGFAKSQIEANSLAGMIGIRSFGHPLSLQLDGRTPVSQLSRHISSCSMLRRVHQSGGVLSDGDLQVLSTLPELRRLSTNGDCRFVTDVGISYLKHLSRLEVLALPQSEISDVSLRLLRSFNNLKVLSIDGTALTSRGLISLCESKSIRMLGVGNKAQVTLSDIRRINQIRPDIVVCWQDNVHGGTKGAYP